MKSLMISSVVVLVALAPCSCQSTHNQARSTVSQAAPQPVEPGKRDSAALAYELAGKTWATNDDALSLIVMLVEGQDNYSGFSERLKALEAKGIVGAGWNLKADQPVTKGSIAFMICRAMNIKGGIMMTVIPSRRYAYRELVYRGMIYRGGDCEPLTGPELVGIIGRAARPQERL